MINAGINVTNVAKSFIHGIESHADKINQTKAMVAENMNLALTVKYTLIPKISK